MEKITLQTIFDRVAISTSLLCMLHCLVTPFLLIAVPVISTTILADELFHKLLVAFILPVSIIALFIGCKRHRDPSVLAFGMLGLISLVLVAVFGHVVLGELGEKVATVIGGIILMIGHFRNYHLCRNDKCDA